MTNNNPAAPTPTPATPTSPTDPGAAVFRNAVENLAFATLIRGILTEEVEHMRLELRGRRSKTSDCNGDLRSEIIQHLTRLLESLNYALTQAGKTLIRPSAQPPPEPTDVIDHAGLIAELTSGRREPSPTRAFPGG